VIYINPRCLGMVYHFRNRCQA